MNPDDIPIQLELIDIEKFRLFLESVNPQNISFVAGILYKFVDDKDDILVKYLFANLSEEIVNPRVVSILINNEIAALTGVMLNENNYVIDKILSYNGDQFYLSEKLVRFLSLRLKQNNGMVLEEIVDCTSEYEPIIRHLNAQNLDIIERNKTNWKHVYHDHLNSSNTNFRIPRRFSSYSLINMDGPVNDKVLIGQGFLLFNSDSKTTIYQLDRNSQHEIFDYQYTVLSKDKIIVSNESLIYIYDSKGKMDHVELLDSPLAAAPKTINNIAYFIDVAGEFYIYDLCAKEFLRRESLGHLDTIVDYVVINEYIVLATKKMLMIKTVDDKKMIAFEPEIEIFSIIGGEGGFFVAANNWIKRFDMNATLLSKHDLYVKPTTNIVILENNKIAFGYENKLLTLLFQGVNAQQDDIVQFESKILDLIVCDNTITVICANGEVLNITDGGSIKIDIEYKSVNPTHASLSVGSGVLCISSHDKLLVCKIA
ncbi:hypothetical protein PAECIP111894_05986 [Paenibacillus pseudetheri]|uniref:Uncharacterized protein n=2 Tax=Paenibacillus pseudetheri TaxID=2897682 RepID=A0ABM9BL71_9BACL|nr:hypothetical protein PAECIP111894_05986 [Paenibacillus pseudetheri]